MNLSLENFCGSYIANLQKMQRFSTVNNLHYTVVARIGLNKTLVYFMYIKPKLRSIKISKKGHFKKSILEVSHEVCMNFK